MSAYSTAIPVEIIEEHKEYIKYLIQYGKDKKKMKEDLYDVLMRFVALKSMTLYEEDEIEIEDLIGKEPTNTFVMWLSLYHSAEINGKKRIAYMINSDDIYEDEKIPKYSGDKENYLKHHKDNLFGLGYIKRLTNIDIYIYVYYKEEHNITIPNENFAWINNICDCVGIEPNHITYFSDTYLKQFIEKLSTNDIENLLYKDVEVVGDNVNILTTSFDNVQMMKDLMFYLKDGIEKKALKKVINEYVDSKVNNIEIRSDVAESVKNDMYKYLIYTSRLTHAITGTYPVFYIYDKDNNKIDRKDKDKVYTLNWNMDVVKIAYNISLPEKYYKVSDSLEIYKGYDNYDRCQIYVSKDDFINDE